MASVQIPKRVAWAVSVLDVGPADRVFEIGCGPGVAASQICDRLVTGHVLAIDRSATAIKKATARNAEHLSSGRAAFEQVDLADVVPPRSRFDKAFAINVNLFWVRSSATELDIIKRLLRRDGALYLFYETPGAGRTRQIAEAVAQNLSRNGFATEVRDGEAPAFGCVVGRPAVR